MIKLTRKQCFERVIEILKGEVSVDEVNNLDEMVEVMNKAIVAIDKKTTATPKNTENESIKQIIIETMETLEEPKSISEIQELCGDLAQYKNQKLSALFTQLKTSGNIIRLKNKKKAVFMLRSKATPEQIAEYENTEKE